MRTLWKSPLDQLAELEIHAAEAAVVTWEGRRALRLENGLAVVPTVQAADLCVEVSISTEGAAYPGVLFRAADRLNYELAYAVPHVCGQWDALQYDPVFHGSNTWQIYCGPAFQATAAVPTGRWFHLRLEVWGDCAALSVDGQPPLVVEQLAHPAAAGRFGLWTFRPAYFSDMRVTTGRPIEHPAGEAPRPAPDAVDAWFAEGYGAVPCEPHGVLNLNRFLPPALGEARLTRRFELSTAGEVVFDLGFSDILSLELDGEVVFEGEHLFQGFADRPARGYAELGTHRWRRELDRGRHTLTAMLQVKEGFGWGLALSAAAKGLCWLPAGWG